MSSETVTPFSIEIPDGYQDLGATTFVGTKHSGFRRNIFVSRTPDPPEGAEWLASVKKEYREAFDRNVAFKRSWDFAEHITALEIARSEAVSRDVPGLTHFVALCGGNLQSVITLTAHPDDTEGARAVFETFMQSVGAESAEFVQGALRCTPPARWHVRPTGRWYNPDRGGRTILFSHEPFAGDLAAWITNLQDQLARSGAQDIRHFDPADAEGGGQPWRVWSSELTARIRSIVPVKTGASMGTGVSARGGVRRPTHDNPPLPRLLSAAASVVRGMGVYLEVAGTPDDSDLADLRTRLLASMQLS